MVTYREVGIIYGGQHIGKGLTRGFVEIDKAMEREALKPHLRPSTWLNLGLGVGLPLISVFAKLRDPWDDLLVLAGGFTSTKVWDYAEEYVAASPSPGGTPPGYVPVPPGYTPVPPPTPTPSPALPPAYRGRYRVTG